MSFKLNCIDCLNILILFILSFIFCSELFFSKYQPQTFDQPTHVTTIAQFSEIIKKGEIPVIWVDKFANYGYPLGLFAQQTTAYFGAFINIIFDNHIFSYNLLVLFGSSLLSISTYLFLRMYFNRKICLVSSSLINFSAYKIINIYIRGALPEFLSTSFFILALLGIHLFFKKKKSYAFFLLTISLVMILLTHPMMFVIYAPFICLYFLLINNFI